MDNRQRERVRQPKQSNKEQRRVQRAAERRERQISGGKDADLEGIIPGPKPGQIIDLD